MRISLSSGLIITRGEDAAKHEAARAQAKALAQDWAAS